MCTHTIAYEVYFLAIQVPIYTYIKCTYMHTCMHVYIYIYIYTHTRTHPVGLSLSLSLSHTHTRVNYMYIHIYIIHTHTHTQTHRYTTVLNGDMVGSRAKKVLYIHAYIHTYTSTHPYTQHSTYRKHGWEPS